MYKLTIKRDSIVRRITLPWTMSRVISLAQEGHIDRAVTH